MKEGVSCEKKMKIGTAEKSDRTVYIPDEIIHRFLSLVDARTAVQTCVFSRKWRNIWVSLPFLNFRTCKFTSVVSYRKFVDEFLTHRKDKSKTNITSIVIDLNDFAAPEIERVFRFAIDRNVQKIEMYNLVFAGALNFEFLKSLCLIECEVSLMDWNCPVLQTLHLDDTLGYAGSNERILNLERFLRLEILILERCVGTGDGPEVIEIRSNTISTLSLLDMGFSDLHICTPNVSSFNFISQHVPTIIFLDGLPSLETAEIDVHVDKYDKYIWEDFDDCNRDHEIKETINLFRAMSETEFIIVSQHTIKVLDAASNLSKYQPPCFRRLRSINLPRQLPTEDRMPSNSPDQVIRYLVEGSPDSNIFVQDRWMRIREYKPKEHILVRDDLGGYSVLTSMESIASEIHVQVQSYIEEHEREIAKREAELSHREAENARQEARLKMERKILEKEKSLLMGAACSLDNQDEALRITLLDNKIQEAKSKKDTLEARALFAKTTTTVSEVLGNVNTSSALSAFEKMEEKVTAMESEADALNQPSSDDFAGQKK